MILIQKPPCGRNSIGIQKSKYIKVDFLITVLFRLLVSFTNE